MADTKDRVSLQTELLQAARDAKSAGMKWDGWNRTLWWTGVTVAGAGVVLGYVAGIPTVDTSRTVQPWMVSALASVGAAIEGIRRRTNWEALGNAYWAKYVDVIQVLRNFHYDIDARKKSDPVRIALEDLADLEDRFGEARNTAMRDRQRSTAKDS